MITSDATDWKNVEGYGACDRCHAGGELEQCRICGRYVCDGCQASSAAPCVDCSDLVERAERRAAREVEDDAA